MEENELETTCYLTRHCDVENPEKVLYGHLANFGLSAKGQDQGRALGRYLSREPVSAIYTSPLQRAMETTSLIVGELALPVPIPERPALVEAEFGRYLQGTKYRDVVWRKPRWWVHMVWPGLILGDESMRQMHDRVDTVIQEGLRDHPGTTFVCISHGDPIQAFWATTDRRPPWALHRLQCAKGGTLRLRYRGAQLVEKAYLSPAEIEATVAIQGRSRALADS
ncbi:MAG: histidine phosphatase family protein [Candidatus Dormibacteria bacterium]